MSPISKTLTSKIKKTKVILPDNPNYFKWIVYLLMSLTILRLAIAPFTGLDGGPAYYAMWSTHWQLSYFDHPGMTAWLMRISTNLLGWNAFAIKLPAILMYLAISVMLYRSIKIWGGNNRGAFYAVGLFNFIPWIASSFGIKAGNPDVPFLLCYICAFYYFSKLYKTGESKNWWWLALWTGLGLLSKYKMVFVYVALFMAMLIFPKLKKQWKAWQLYVAAAIAFLGMVPAIIWNVQNEFASFQYHLVQRQSGFGFRPMQYLDFLGNQILIMGIFAPLLLFKNSFDNRKTEVGKVCLIFAAPALVVFSIAALFFSEPMQNWWASVYLILLVAYGVQRKFGQYDKFVLAITALVSILGTTYYIYPFAVRAKETSSMLDHHLFDKAANHLQEIIKRREILGEEVYVATSRYRITAMINVYMPEQKIYSLDYRKGDQFQLWYPPQELKGKDIIYVLGGSKMNDKLENFIKADAIKLFDKQVYEYNSHFSRTFYFYDVKNFQGIK